MEYVPEYIEAMKFMPVTTWHVHPEDREYVKPPKSDKVKKRRKKNKRAKQYRRKNRRR